MAIEQVFEGLTKAFVAVREALEGLALTVIEDRPPQDEVLLVERLGNLVDDLRGWTEEGCALAAQAQQAVTHPPDYYAARVALGTTHERLRRIHHRFLGEALDYDTIDELLRFGEERG